MPRLTGHLCEITVDLPPLMVIKIKASLQLISLVIEGVMIYFGVK